MDPEIRIHDEVLFWLRFSLSSPPVFGPGPALQAEILALRHQLAVHHKNAPPRLLLQPSDRWLWVLLSRRWSGWRACLQIVQPDTVVGWHRAFAWYWTRKSRQYRGRPEVAAEIRDLIRRMSQANRLWGACHSSAHDRCTSAIDLQMQLAHHLFSVCVLEQRRKRQHSRLEGMNKSKAITPRESATNQLLFAIEDVLSPSLE